MRYNQRTLYLPTKLITPVGCDEKDITTKLNIIIFTVPFLFLCKRHCVEIDKETCNNNNNYDNQDKCNMNVNWAKLEIMIRIEKKVSLFFPYTLDTRCESLIIYTFFFKFLGYCLPKKKRVKVKGPPQLKKSLKFQLLAEIFWPPPPPLFEKGPYRRKRRYFVPNSNYKVRFFRSSNPTIEVAPK